MIMAYNSWICIVFCSLWDDDGGLLLLLEMYQDGWLVICLFFHQMQILHIVQKEANISLTQYWNVVM